MLTYIQIPFLVVQKLLVAEEPVSGGIPNKVTLITSKT